jgi:DNA-binding LytR/AlgR family response regulator
MIRCIAIDDQQNSISGIEKYIADAPNMELLASYTDPMTALNELKKIDQVDVIFMDIQMPQISGIELSKAIRSKTRKLIFTTSHEEYAFEAFEAEADAYLLKPYGYAKFALTVNRMFEDETEDIAQEAYFFVKNKSEEHKAVLVRYADIIAFESFHNYIKIHTKEKVIIAYLSLKDVKEQLNIEKGFIQLHRGYIISINHILHVEGTRVTLSNHTSFTVGDLYYNDFRDFFTDKLITSKRNK